MRRAAKWAGAVLGGLVVLVAVLLAVVVGGSATPPGQAAIERLVPPLTDGMLRVTGLSGWVFGASRIARIAASLMLSGVSKSGSPAPSPMTSRPAALSARALSVTAMVADGLMRMIWSAMKAISDSPTK